MQLAVDLARDHLRLADGELEALAAHRLHEYGELKLAAALHLPGVAAVAVHHADRDVAHQLALEPVLHHARGEPGARLARERRGVDPDRHAEGRLVDRDQRKRPRVLGVGDRLADRDLRDAGDGDDLAGAGLVGRHAREPLVHVQLGEPDVLDRAVAPDPRHLLALADRSVVHAAEREPADVRVGVEVRDARLKRVRLVVGRRRDALHEQVEQRAQVGALHALLGRGLSRLRVRVDDRELDLLLVRVEVEEQLVDLVHHLADARVGAVDLVHDEHHRQARLERLAQHEAGLGERALGGVHEEHHAVHHRQAALHLAAEVGVAGGVHEVELHGSVADRGVLGEDRDAALALLVHRVHDEVGEPLGLVDGEHAGLAQHRVDQGGLAVVDVGDDRDVADV